MNTTLIGNMIGLNFNIKNPVTLSVIAVAFILLVSLFFVFVSFKKRILDSRKIYLTKEDLGSSELAKKKKQGKYFWD